MGSETILRDNALSGLIPRARIVSDPVKVYGTVNCNTVKAARAWLDKRKLGYEFVDEKSAIALMREKPTVIKRPVVESGETLLSGFDEAEYAKKL